MNAPETPHAAVWAFVLIASCGWALAQEVGSREWLADAIQRAPQVSLPTATHLELEYSRYAAGDASTLQQLERAVDERPEHPERPRLVELKRRLSEGPDVTTDRVWFFGPAHWRVSRDQPWLKGTRRVWQDAAQDGDGAWRLLHDTLTLLPVRDPAPGYDPRVDLLMAESAWRELTTSGLPVEPGWTVADCDVIGSDWAATIHDAEGVVEFKLRGSKLDSGALFIQEILVTRSAEGPEWLGYRRVFSRDESIYIPEQIPGLLPASSMTRSSPRGALAPEQWTIRKVEPIEPVMAQSLLRAPLPGATDEIRDISGLTGVVDRAKGTMSLLQTGGGEEFVSGPMSGVSKPRGSVWLQPVALVVLGLCAAGLVVLKIKKSHHSYKGEHEWTIE